jgi:hypothetical protein
VDDGDLPEFFASGTGLDEVLEGALEDGDMGISDTFASTDGVDTSNLPDFFQHTSC